MTVRGVAHDMVCLQCGARLTILIFLCRRTCPKCHKEFLIENDVPKKPGTEKKPSESVHASKNSEARQIPLIREPLQRT